MNTDEMHEKIKCLYSEVFLFLGSAMKWYKSGASRKILDSLKEDRADELKEHLDKIKSMCDSIRNDSQSRSRAEVRDLRLQYQHDKTQDRHDRTQDKQVQDERHEGLQNSIAQMQLLAFHAAEQGKLEREQERQNIYHDYIPRAMLEDIGKVAGRFLQDVQQTWLREEDKPNPNIPISGKRLLSLVVETSLFILGLTIRRLTEDVEPRARLKRSKKSKGLRQPSSSMDCKC